MINDFCSQYLSEYTYLSIDAYISSVNIRSILTTIAAHLQLNCTLMTCNGFVVDWATTIADRIDRLGIDLIIIVHNIDGPALR
jgi:hypothetical protein